MVTLLVGHGRGAHHLRVAVIHHEIVGAQRGRLCPGDLRGTGHPGLLVGHHAGRVPFLLDLWASLGHQTQDRSIIVHVGLGLNVLNELRPPEGGCHEEPPVDAARRAVVGVHLGTHHLRQDAGVVGRGAALLQGVVASRGRVCLVKATAFALGGGIIPAGSALAVAIAAHGKDKIQHVVEILILFAWREAAPGAGGGLGLLLTLPPLGREKRERVRGALLLGGRGGTGSGCREPSVPSAGDTHFVQGFLSAGAGEGGEGGQGGVAERHGAGRARPAALRTL